MNRYPFAYPPQVRAGQMVVRDRVYASQNDPYRRAHSLWRGIDEPNRHRARGVRGVAHACD